MQATTKAVLGSVVLAIGTHAAAQVTVFNREGFARRYFTASGPVGDFSRHGFNDRASSAVVRGQDIATGVGAVGGAALGARLGRGSGGDTVVMQDVQRCENVSPYSQPDYWDVT